MKVEAVFRRVDAVFKPRRRGPGDSADASAAEAVEGQSEGAEEGDHDFRHDSDDEDRHSPAKGAAGGAVGKGPAPAQSAR